MEHNLVCKQCLLKEMSEHTYFKNLYEYIDGINADIKTSDEEYERRLSLCKSCENLMNGMCRVCGCFVELRAVIRNNYCPDKIRHW